MSVISWMMSSTFHQIFETFSHVDRDLALVRQSSHPQPLPHLGNSKLASAKTLSPPRFPATATPGHPYPLPTNLASIRLPTPVVPQSTGQLMQQRPEASTNCTHQQPQMLLPPATTYPSSSRSRKEPGHQRLTKTLWPGAASTKLGLIAGEGRCRCITAGAAPSPGRGSVPRCCGCSTSAA